MGFSRTKRTAEWLHWALKGGDFIARGCWLVARPEEAGTSPVELGIDGHSTGTYY